MKSNYDVYLCRGFQQLVGISMNEFLSKMDYLESIKSSGDCWVLFYDDDTKLITRVENMKIGQSAFNQRVSESCFVIGGPFEKAQHIPSLNSQEILNNKILAAYDENVARREAEKCDESSYKLIKLPEIKESKPASFLYKVSVFAVSFLAAMSIVLLLLYIVIQIKSPT